MTHVVNTSESAHVQLHPFGNRKQWETTAQTAENHNNRKDRYKNIQVASHIFMPNTSKLLYNERREMVDHRNSWVSVSLTFITVTYNTN